VFGSSVEQCGGRVTDQPFVPIVREPDLPRLTAASGAILAEMQRLAAAGVDRADLVAGLYAARALVADDDHGRGRGMVVQADGLRWGELEDLVGLAAPVLDPARHAGTGTWHPDCPACRGAQAAARIRAHRRYRTVGPGVPFRPEPG
jgi:hypothetical protein